MIEHSTSIVAISKALMAFQGAVDGVERDRTNPHFKSRYATLEAVRDTAVPQLQNVGIVYMQSPGAVVDGNMSFTTLLVHAESGEWIKFTGDIPLGKKDPQGAGSAITYMSRYSLMAALGLPAVDDDGNDSMPEKRQEPSTPKPKETKYPLQEGERRKLWERMMNDLKGEAPKGADAMVRYMQSKETQEDLARLEPWRQNFRKEAADLVEATKAAEGIAGETGATIKRVKAPDFSSLAPNDLDPIEQIVGRHE